MNFSMNKIFYVLSSVALSALAVSCQKETEFKIEGTPNFTISVGSDVIVDTDSENFNYTLNLAHQEYSAKKSVKTGNDDVLASSVFEVRSNLRWKIAPADENVVYDWVSPFPGVGEKDGKFIFKASRNLPTRKTVTHISTSGSIKETVSKNFRDFLLFIRAKALILWNLVRRSTM